MKETYKVDYDKMFIAMSDLLNFILLLQANSYDVVAKLVAEREIISEELQADFTLSSSANITVDVKILMCLVYKR